METWVVKVEGRTGLKKEKEQTLEDKCEGKNVRIRERKMHTKNVIALERKKDENDKKTQKKEAEGFDKGRIERNEGDDRECRTNFIGD